MSEEREKSTPDLSALFSQISSNPKAMTMLASLLGGASQQSPKEEHHCEPACVSEICTTPSHRKICYEDRKRLLLALKPFLSPDRCQTVDMLLIVLEAFSAFRGGKG